MIVFIEDINLIKYFNDPIIFNLSSYYSGYNSITNLITIASALSQNIVFGEFVQKPEFDIYYMNMIFSNKELFNSLMSVVHCAANGNNAIVLVKHDPFRDAIMESIIKLIQQRYGYQCWVLDSVDDLCCLSEPVFTPYGLLNMDEDLKRFNFKYDESYLEKYEGRL